MAIKGLTSNLSSVRENRSRLIIGAVTLAAGLGRYVVVHGCGSDRGNGDKRWGGRTGFLTGCQSWTMSSFFPEQALAATTADSIIHFTRCCVFLSAQNSASSEAFSTLWFPVLCCSTSRKKAYRADKSQVMNYNFYSVIIRHLHAF